MGGIKEQWNALNTSFLITAKLLYFALNLEMYAFYLYRSIFITQYLGVSIENYGIIASVMACVSFPFMTVWGTLADGTGRPKAVLTVLAVLTAACFELLFIKVGEKGSWKQFVYVLGVLIAYAAFCAGLQPLLDVIALKILSALPNFSKDVYGRQRLWGTLAYAVVTLIAAFLMDAIGQEILFVVVPVSAGIFAATLHVTPPESSRARVLVVLVLVLIVETVPVVLRTQSSSS
jgi:MFS family permease